MKKILFVMLAAVGLASCVQTEELGVANNNEAIAFDPFVENATKAPMHTTGNLESFNVYGTISKNGAVVTNIFPGVPVTKDTNTGVWAYEPQYTQYWVAGFTYDFAAVVDATVAQVANGMPTTLSTDLQEQNDVLYATVSREFNGGQTSKVSFNFDHLLSKAKFTVKNTISEGENFFYNIESIKIKNADKNATYTVNDDGGVWTATSTYDADFGVATSLAMGANVVSQDVLLLPSNNKNLEIEVVYNLTYNNAILKSETKTLNAVLTLEQGKAYNFIVEFGNPGEEIEFEAVVDGWETGNLSDYILEADGFGKDVNTGIYHIQNLAGLEYFAAQVNGGRSFNGQTVVLDTNIDLATRAGSEWTPIGADSSKYFEGTFDGQDHTISNFQVNREGLAGLFGYARATFKNLSVENVTLVAHHYAGALVGQGYVKLDNCHAKNVNITLSAKDNDWGDKAGGIVGQLLEGATLGISNSTVESVTIKGYRDLGGVTGMAHDNNFVKNCSAKNVTLIQDLSDNYQSTTPTTLGAVVGRFGSNVVYEGCTEEDTTYYKYAANQDGFVSALALGGDILLAAGEYDFPASGVYAGEVKVLPEALVVRSGAGVVVNLPQSTYIPGTTLTLKGVTFKVPAGLTYNESAFAFIHHAAKFNMNNCVIDGGRLRLNVKEANIDQCQFNVTTSSGLDGYGLFYYGPSDSQVNVSNSTFTTCGKAIVLYNEGPCELNLKVEGCEFTSSNPDTDKAAISVHSEGGIHGTLDIVNSTATGFANHNDGLWRDVNNGTGEDNNKFTVEVNEDVVMVEGATVVNTWEEFTAALANNAKIVFLKNDIEYTSNYQLQKDVNIYLGGKSMTLPMINIHNKVTVQDGTINGKMYACTGCNLTLDGMNFSGTISDNLSTEGHLQVQGGCDVYAKDCVFAATTVNGSQTRSLSIEGSSSGTRKFENCNFKFLSWGTGPGKYKKNVYINTMSGTTTVEFVDCKFNGKAPNILFAAAKSLSSLSMMGCDNTGPTLEINRAKDVVTEAEWAHISSLIANNKFTQVRVFYNATTSEDIKK